jgi:hypothetical protein
MNASSSSVEPDQDGVMKPLELVELHPNLGLLR